MIDSTVENMVFLPAPRNRLLPWLVEDRGDIAAVIPTSTEGRQKLVDFCVRSSHIAAPGPGR